MAGFFLVSDDEEAKIDLPRGAYDIPLVIQDRTFDADNQLVYLGNGRMRRMQGFLGDQILVNGQPEFSLSVATRAYRLRLLNGSNSRIYKLAWDDGRPLTVIGTDGGLLERPIQRPYVVLGPGQRLDLWADFSNQPVGKRITLRSLEFSPMLAGDMMGGMMGRGMMGGRRGRGMMGGTSSLPNGSDFPVLTVTVDRKEDETLRLPEKLTNIDRYNIDDAENKSQPRTFEMLMRHMTWTINGRVFEMTNVSGDEIVRLNTLEAWDLVNGGGGMMGMSLPHPIHLHGQQFQVLERFFDPALAADWASLKDGVIDEGWQDVVMLFPRQKVRILREFSDFEGLFLYHCHNLEHEDMGMMRNFLVKA
jgi:FtsP/CotA-like multicopper oxidase with cupredoxin domain